MKKWWTFCLMILGLLVFPWLSLQLVQAAAGQQSFTALDATCLVIPGSQWISGNILHIRGEGISNRRALLIHSSMGPTG